MNDERGRSPPAGCERPCTSTAPEHDPLTTTSDAVSAEMHVLPSPVLSVLKTKAESRAQTATIRVWIVELPAKAANSTLLTCKEQIPNQDAIDLQHLRRFITPINLPEYLQPDDVKETLSNSRSTSVNSDASSRGSKSKSRSRSRSRRRRRGPAPTLYLLVCPSQFIDYEDLSALLMTQPTFAEGYPLKLQEITVPLLPPTSIEQAHKWTAQYWPTTYRKTNPFGPHPTMVTKAEEELGSSQSVSKYMSMAYETATQAKAQGLGIRTGCVVVERLEGNQEHIIAVAGDARHCGSICGDKDRALGAENVAAHAVLRAIGMVARKRVRVASPKPVNSNGNSDIMPNKLLVTPVEHSKNAPESVVSALLDYPLTDSERAVFDEDNLIPNGYLCVDLEIYLTHEPCLMCSMAIVHSRFGRCVFGQRMPASGGMSADSDLGYGLFWRSELNWKLLCWEYNDPARKTIEEADADAVRDHTQV